MAVTIYTKTGCPYCKSAKESFDNQGIKFKEINVSDEPGKIDELVKIAGVRKVPVTRYQLGSMAAGEEYNPAGLPFRKIFLEVRIMNCERCKDNIPEGEQFEHMGQTLCEDCYIEAIEPPRTCDVAAVYSAKLSRKAAGQEGTDGLTELQKDIYNYVKGEGPVTHDQIMKKFMLPKWQLEKQFATLRHCELLRGFRKEGKVFVTIWEEGTPGELKIEGN